MVLYLEMLGSSAALSHGIRWSGSDLLRVPVIHGGVTLRGDRPGLLSRHPVEVV